MNIIEVIEWGKLFEIFFATFVGVFSAFQLERFKINQDKKEESFCKFVAVQAELQMQKNLLEVINTEIFKLKNDKQRTGMLGPMTLSLPEDYIQISDLNFMLGKENVLALNIIALQSNIKNTFVGLTKRNEQHEVIQKTAHTSFQGGDVKKLYNVNYKLLEDMTNDLYSNVEDALKNFEVYYKKFDQYGLNTFKNKQSTKLGKAT